MYKEVDVSSWRYKHAHKLLDKTKCGAGPVSNRYQEIGLNALMLVHHAGLVEREVA